MRPFIFVDILVIHRVDKYDWNRLLMMRSGKIRCGDEELYDGGSEWEWNGRDEEALCHEMWHGEERRGEERRVRCSEA